MDPSLPLEDDRVDDDALDQTAEALHAFALAEQFAVETYDAALARVASRALRAELARLRDSHRRRAAWLRGVLSRLGRPCRDCSGPWGAFANAFRRILGALDDTSTLAALREGEAWGVRDYEADLDELTDALRDEVARRMLPEQRRTSARVDDLARGA